ncbi:auxilin-related protein 2-like [Impatiens glandulifera]|uniref:auxilin-related protein 2-like n=1 Tax=Impatiens glandulifera TaxID=253017 RepID=UPI001FB090CF|nr:auxilin-related protein 2-like [Impatiens glandulifera]XP_047341397.1 auxilin-related protein 2-like [Impatiens glandulifera]
MDEFGVLVESIGFRAGGKSAPLADLKSEAKSSSSSSSSLVNNPPKQVYSSKSGNGSFDIDLDGFFGSNNDRKTQNHDGFDDIFGQPIKSSSKDGLNFNFAKKKPVLNDMFSGIPTSKKATPPVEDDDDFWMNSAPKYQSAPDDDMFGNFVGSASNTGEKDFENDLLPGFSSSTSSARNEGVDSKESWSPFSSYMSAEPTPLTKDPFDILETSSSKSYIYSKSLGHDSKRNSVLSSADELEDFASAKVWSRQNRTSEYPKQENWGSGTAADDLDIFFKKDLKSNNGSKPHSVTKDPVCDTLFQKKDTGARQNSPLTTTIRMNSMPNMVDDFSFMFGGGVPSAEEFQEIEGESEERRKARLNQHMRTQQRMAKALEEKNKRDHETRLEQEERHRIGGALDEDIKRWATGKEGNLRALLSSLQLILWPECGWQQVSLIDLITSVSVKKVYYKATLCVHPDKVQQKGASLHQKYIAEKVFDILKEAWKKFELDELR